MQHYIAGIDTGGTCTDAILINKETQDVVVTARVPTTVSFPPFSEVGNAVGAGWTGFKRMESAKDHIS